MGKQQVFLDTSVQVERCLALDEFGLDDWVQQHDARSSTFARIEFKAALLVPIDYLYRMCREPSLVTFSQLKGRIDGLSGSAWRGRARVCQQVLTKFIRHWARLPHAEATQSASVDAEMKHALAAWITKFIPFLWRTFSDGLSGPLEDHIGSPVAAAEPEFDPKSGHFRNIRASEMCRDGRLVRDLRSYLRAWQRRRPQAFSRLLSASELGRTSGHLRDVLEGGGPLSASVCFGRWGVGNVVVACEAADSPTPRQLATYDAEFQVIAPILRVELADDLPRSDLRLPLVPMVQGTSGG